MWIELHDSSRDHPKIIKAAKELQISQVEMLGHMCSLWTWTLRMAPDGDLGSFDSDDIAIGAMWDADPALFVGACVKYDLLDVTEYGMAVHDWEDFSGSLKSAKRAREYRSRKRNAASRDGHVMSRDSTVISRRTTERPNDRTTDHIARSSEQSSDSAPAVFELNLIPRDGTFPITQLMVDEWAESYPGIDVPTELRKAIQWCRDNPKRRKTLGGARKFLGGWLGRAQDKSRGPPAGRREELDDRMEYQRKEPI